MSKEEAVKLLIEDEVEAIKGYEKYLDQFTDEQRAIIEEIINDERKHIALLKGLKEKEIFGV